MYLGGFSVNTAFEKSEDEDLKKMHLLISIVKRLEIQDQLLLFIFNPLRKVIGDEQLVLFFISLEKKKKVISEFYNQLCDTIIQVFQLFYFASSDFAVLKLFIITHSIYLTISGHTESRDQDPCNQTLPLYSVYCLDAQIPVNSQTTKVGVNIIFHLPLSLPTSIFPSSLLSATLKAL